jgi:membrane associated rhomboid family serine protease
MQYLSQFYSQSPATSWLMFLVILFSLTGQANKKLFFEFILHPRSVTRDKQYYRIITADWTNADFMHLLVNELMLYVFCSDLEETFRSRSANGSIQFLIIYAASLLVGSAFIIIRHYKDFEYSTTGTSGSIMGCMFSFMLVAPNYIVYHLPVFGEVKNIYAGLIYIVILIIYQRRKKDEMINHEFHFYGAIGGILATLIIYPGML